MGTIGAQGRGAPTGIVGGVGPPAAPPRHRKAGPAPRRDRFMAGVGRPRPVHSQAMAPRTPASSPRPARSTGSTRSSGASPRPGARATGGQGGSGKPATSRKPTARGAGKPPAGGRASGKPAGRKAPDTRASTSAGAGGTRAGRPTRGAGSDRNSRGGEGSDSTRRGAPSRGSTNRGAPGRRGDGARPGDERDGGRSGGPSRARPTGSSSARRPTGSSDRRPSRTPGTDHRAGSGPPRSSVVRKGWGSVARRGATQVRNPSTDHGGSDRSHQDASAGRGSARGAEEFVPERWSRSDGRDRDAGHPEGGTHRPVRYGHPPNYRPT